jgi:hypothetical protein
MTTSRAFATPWSVWGVLGLTASALLFSPVLVTAQKGENAVYISSSITGSTAFIDASAFCGATGSGACGGAGTDVCTMIGTALSNYIRTSAGVVVDARGVIAPPNPGPAPQTCPNNPFAAISQTNTVPIIVLLPASTINIKTAWTLPNNTRLVGEGSFTVLQALSPCCAGAMIEMGQPPLSGQSCPSTPYSGISIEHLKLTNPSGLTGLGGIDNECAQTSSYVNDVGMSDLTGTGLMIGPGATNSGPYANVSFAAASRSTCSGGSSPDLTTNRRLTATTNFPVLPDTEVILRTSNRP